MDRAGRRASRFTHGGCQAVRLPKEYRFEGQREVVIRREGERVILEPLRPSWSKRFIELAGTAKDFPYPEPLLPADAPPDLE